MKNLEEVMNAFARLMEKPRNPIYAMQELMEKLDKHGREALREWDEVSNTMAGLVETVNLYASEKEEVAA